MKRGRPFSLDAAPKVRLPALRHLYNNHKDRFQSPSDPFVPEPQIKRPLIDMTTTTQDD